MRKFLSGVVFSFFLSIVFFGVIPTVLGADGLEPVAQSQAFEEFLKKPANDLSKMICILNYLGAAPIVVRYDGIDYTAQAAYPFGLVYLMTNYHNENPEAWARKHCYRSLFGNNIILFKFQNGSFRPARDVILEKYKELEKALRERASRA